MKIKDIMTSSVERVSPDDTVGAAAKKMSPEKREVLVVSGDEKLLGVVSHRNIVERVVARDLGPEDVCVGEVMSNDVMYVYDDEDVDVVADDMSKLHVQELPVLDRRKKLVGMVALADLMSAHDARLEAILTRLLPSPTGTQIHMH